MAWRGATQPNLNAAPNRINHGPEMSGAVRMENRTNSTRRDTDAQKNFSVSLLDVDSTIFTHLNNVVNPQFVDNGHLVKVPINYASPERWKSIRQDGFMRDKHGKVQCPAITYRRTTMQRNDQLITFNRHLSMPFVKSYTAKNQYDRFSLMNKFLPTKEIHSIAMPDHIIVNYDFIIWTEKIEQLNKVVEQINWTTEDYWGDKNRFKFRISISDYNFQTEVSADQDRVVKATFTMLVYAYLLPEATETMKATTQKSFSLRKVAFNVEASGTVDELARLLTSRQASSGSQYTRGIAINELANADSYTDKTDFEDGEANFEQTWDFQATYMTKTGSVITTDNGSGSSVFVFKDTLFNTDGSGDEYKKLIVFVDDAQVKNQSITTTVSGSSIYVIMNNTYSGVTPTTGSTVVGYGNIY
jgi:hypothetical protein